MANAFDQFDGTFPPETPGVPRITITAKKNAFDQFDPSEAKAKAPDVGRGTAAAEGFMAGLSGNFRDEIYGASKASGLPDWMGGYRAPVGAAKLAYENFVEGKPGEASKVYDEAVTEKRAITKAAQEQYPGTYIAGNAAAGMMLPVGGVMSATTMGGRALGSAAIGAGYGALSGAGEGENLPDRAGRAAVGAGLGAAVGAVAAPLVEGAAQVGRRVLEPIINAGRGALNPEAEASRRVVTSLQRDAQADPNAVGRLTPQEFVGNAQNGGPARVMDLGGDLTRRVADSAAITSPEGGTALKQVLSDRFETQAGRIKGWLNDTFHYPDAHAQQAALDLAEKQTNKAGYFRAYRAGDREIVSPELERIMGSPDVVDAMRAAVEKGKTRAIAQGYGAFNPAVKVENGMVEFLRKPNGTPTYPNIQFWDYTYRALRDAKDAAFRAGRNDEGNALASVAKSMRAELDKLVPEYGQARGAAMQFFEAENALEAGQNYVMKNFANKETEQALKNMTPVQRQLFQDGFVSRFIETLDKIGDRRSILNQIADNPAARQKLDIALGPRRAAELEARLRVEGIMDATRNAVQGNSWTVRRLYDLGLAGGAGLGAQGTYSMDPHEMTYGALLAAASSGGKKIDQRVARRVAEILTSRDPNTLRLGVQIVSNNPQMMNALRSVDRNLAAIGGEQVPTAVPALQSVGIGRAEDNQPNVPRPPGQ